MKKIILCFVLIFAFAAAACAEAAVSLPQPKKSGGTSLLDSLAARRSEREFADTALTQQQLSDLLWATGGVNRDNGSLTYPTAMNVQDIIIYAVTREGVYRYEPKENSLAEVEKGDYRAETGMQPFAAKAAVNLVLVQDKSKWEKLKKLPPAEDILRMGSIHAGSAIQNAGLFAASQGWANVVRGSFDQKKLAARLKLNEQQMILITQSIGPNK